MQDLRINIGLHLASYLAMVRRLFTQLPMQPVMAIGCDLLRIHRLIILQSILHSELNWKDRLARDRDVLASISAHLTTTSITHACSLSVIDMASAERQRKLVYYYLSSY